MGFAAGFAAGWGAVDSALRAKADQERMRQEGDIRAADLAMRQDEAAFRKEDRDRARMIKRDIADASAAPTTGVSVGTNFATGGTDQQFLRGQAEAEAEMAGMGKPGESPAASSGNQVVRFSNAEAAAKHAADRTGRAGYTMRVADVYRKHGEDGKARELEAEFQRLSKEGYKEALDYGLATGDWAGAGERFNGQGSSRLPDGATLKGTQVERVGPGGEKIPDTMLQVVDANGQVVRDLGSAIQLRHKAEGFEQWQAAVSRERTEGRQERQVAATERNSATQERRAEIEAKRIEIQQQLADARERRDEAQIKHWEGQLAVQNRKLDSAIARAASGSGGGGKDDDPQQGRLKASEEKALAEVVAGMVTDQTKAAGVTTAAHALMVANPSMDMHQAAALASSPGAAVQSGTIQGRPAAVLMVPDRKGKDASGKDVLIPGGQFLMARPVQRLPNAPPPENNPKKEQAQVSPARIAAGPSGPSYEGWMAAKNAIAEVEAQAARMTPDRREVFLGSRLPDLQQQLKFHSAYNKVK